LCIVVLPLTYVMNIYSKPPAVKVYSLSVVTILKCHIEYEMILKGPTAVRRRELYILPI